VGALVQEGLPGPSRLEASTAVLGGKHVPPARKEPRLELGQLLLVRTPDQNYRGSLDPCGPIDVGRERDPVAHGNGNAALHDHLELRSRNQWIDGRASTERLVPVSHPGGALRRHIDQIDLPSLIGPNEEIESGDAVAELRQRDVVAVQVTNDRLDRFEIEL